MLFLRRPGDSGSGGSTAQAGGEEGSRASRDGARSDDPNAGTDECCHDWIGHGGNKVTTDRDGTGRTPPERLPHHLAQTSEDPDPTGPRRSTRARS